VINIAEILEKNKIQDYDIDTYELGFAERIIAWVLNPFISGILILIIIGGIYFEMQAPGIGFPLLAAVVALVLYLVPYYLNGLAAYWEIIALFAGVVLIALEIFVIPGFGVAGISGIIMTVGSLVLIMLRNDFFNFDFIPLGDIVVAMVSAMGGLAGGVVILILGGAKIANTAAFKKITLSQTQESSQGYTVNANAIVMNGKRGIAHTVLRPSGKIMIEEQLYDAFTRGEFVERGEQIEVISSEGITLKVKKV